MSIMNIERIIKHRDLRDSTLNLYVRYGEKLAEHLEKKTIGGKDILENEGIINLFIDSLSHHQKKLLISTMLVILSPKQKDKPMKRWRAVYENYRDMLGKIHKEYIDEKKKNVKNEKEEKNWIEWHEVVLTLIKLKETYEKTKKPYDFKKWMVLALYCYDSNPPRRLEYCYTKIIKEKTFNDYNETLIKNNVYLVVPEEDNMYWSFGTNKCKTKKYKINQIIPLGDNLNDVLVKYAHDHIGEALLPNRKNKKIGISSGSLTTLLKSLFNKNISATMLRKIYLSYKTKNNITMEEREKIADLMGHSVNYQMTMYSKQ